MADDQPTESGWHPAPGDPRGFVRYWDGVAWIGDPVELGMSSEVFQFARRKATEDAIRRSGARAGEGIPFHELYLRRKSKKRDWNV